jgi:chemotaxis protein histidine kinase CheA
MYTEHESGDYSSGDDEEIKIGSVSVPAWQFSIYHKEAARYLVELDVELISTKKSGVKKNILRVIHTLAGISNTLGIEQTAVLGYAIEAWLTSLSENNGALTVSEKDLLDMSCIALSEMVQLTRNKEDVLDRKLEIVAILRAVSEETLERRLADYISDTALDDVELNEKWVQRELDTIDSELHSNAPDDAVDSWLVDLEALVENIDAAVRASDISTDVSEEPVCTDVSILETGVSLYYEPDKINAETELPGNDSVQSLLNALDVSLLDVDGQDMMAALFDDLDAITDDNHGIDEGATLSLVQDVLLDQASLSNPIVNVNTFVESTIVSSLNVDPVTSASILPIKIDIVAVLLKKESASQKIGTGKYDAYVLELIPGDTVYDNVEPDIRDIFIEEAIDIFEGMPRVIEAWSDSDGMDPTFETEVKRALHTLKGSSRMAGYFRFGAVVHNIETVVETSHAVLPKKDIPYLVQAVFDALTQELTHIQDPSKPAGFPGVVDFDVAIDNKLEKVIDPLVYGVDAINLPPRVQRNGGGEDASLNAVLRVPTEKIDMLSGQMSRSGTLILRLTTSVGRLDSQISEISSNMVRLRKLLSEVEVQAESQMRSRLDDIRGAATGFDPLRFDRFTRLQELTRMTAEAIYDIENSQQELASGVANIHEALAEQTAITDDMHYAVMSVRTVPLNSLARRLEQVVRLACRDTGKEADLRLDSTVEVDSGVLNKIVTALEHLLRNALAHGIEMPDVRLARGKIERGCVLLKVRPRGNDIVFTLSDDGAGINRAVIEKKARQKGIISASETITQEKANRLIFDAGFSTEDSVSEISGRGIGMDVVASEISALGGRINIESADGKGATFELLVPSYMSVISIVPVIASGVCYAIPSALVRDVVVVRGPVLVEAYENKTILIDDVKYPFYGLSEASVLDAQIIGRSNRVMIIEDSGSVVALHIDSLEFDRNLVVRPLCRTIASLPGFLGASVAGDGSPLLVINPVTLMALVIERKNTAPIAVEIANVIRTHADMTIMVVDDSLTVRRITQRFLQRVGFKVILATDGLDAIEKIAQFGAPDLFLTDIEMPNMNGFQLTEHIRTSVSKTVPIVMISSRVIEKYSDQARSIGVDRSLGKPYQEPELLDIVENLLGLKLSS